MPLFPSTQKHGAFGQSIIVILLVCWTVTAWTQSRLSGERLAQATSGRLVRVAAASDLKFALDDISAAFRTQHPDITVQVSYGSSGNFFAQLSNRAPFDMFFSADVDYPRQLIAQGLARIEAFRIRALVEGERNQLLEQAPVATALMTGPRHVFRLANPLYREIVAPLQPFFVGEYKTYRSEVKYSDIPAGR